MSPSVPDRAAGQTPSATDLPYGPLPARSDQSITVQPHLEPPLRPSRLEREPPAVAGAVGEDAGPITQEGASSPGSQDHRDGERVADHEWIGEHVPERSSELEVAAARDDADDDVHFAVAAKALGISRKTVERMVKREELERGPSGAPATVSKRGLVALLEQRRRDVSHLTRATEVENRQFGSTTLKARWPEDATTELQELLRPFLEPLIEEFVAARTRAEVLESQVDGIVARAGQERARDEMMLALATGGWRQRRKARRAGLRHYVLRDDVPGSGPSSAAHLT